MRKSIMILLILAGFCFTAPAKAELAITEIMSQSAHVGGTNGDWWELTNTGSSSVNLTGYSWDDDHQRVGQNIFGAVSIGPGESIIILAHLDDDTVDWRSDWGTVEGGVNVYDRDYFSFNFSGLGDPDGVFLYDTGNVLVTSVTYPSRATGISNEWDTSGTFLGLSVIGVNGAYQSLNIASDVASPGYAVVTVVEPCVGGSGKMLYWTDKDFSKIQRLNLDNDCLEDILIASDGLVNPRGFAIDTSTNKMYWSDGTLGEIRRANLDGSSNELLLTGLRFPTDLALDLDAGKIYFSQTELGFPMPMPRIRKVDLDGTGPIEDVITGIGVPYYLTLDLTNSRIYWADVQNTVIRRANLDGTGIVDFITGLTYVRDVVLDADGNKIYWCDRGSSTVQRANLNDGSGIEILYGPTGLATPHGLLLDDTDDSLYWTDTDTTCVYRGNKDGTAPMETLASGLDGPWALAIVTITRVIYVDADRPPGGDGTSWDTAYKYLSDGLDAALSRDEIHVAQGIYKPLGNRRATFQLITGVALKGGYAGYGEPNPDERDIETYETILSGDRNGDDAVLSDPEDLLTEPTRSENSYHVVTGRDIDETAVLDGFTITAGNANGSFGDFTGVGGGMLNNGHEGECSPTVIECTFIGNSAVDLGGGGMFNYAHGGGVSDPILTNCKFVGNASASIGGGVYNLGDSSPVVTNCTFIGNFAAGNGGGMGNSTFGAPSVCSPTLTNCIFTGNLAVNSGGGMWNYESSNPILTNCTFSGNSVENDGGGMYNLLLDSLTLTNCTFSGNSAGNDGGGMYNQYLFDLTLTNSIFWDNNDSGGTDESAQIYHSDVILLDVNYNCVQGWTGDLSGSGNHGDDPLFIDADGADNITGTEDDDLRLSAGSPCFDAGDNTVLPPDIADLDDDDNTAEPTPLDLDGNPRIINGTVDMGAYELGPNAETCYADFNGDLFMDLYDLSILAQEWLSTGDSLATDLIDDDEIDKLDLAAFAERWLMPCYLCSQADIYTDGKIDLKDYSILANDWLQEGPNLDGDITGNWVVDMSDLNVLLFYWLSPCYLCSEADIYTDGKIDLKDYSILANDWLQEGPNLDGDITGNWVVDMSDLNVLLFYWLNTCQ